MSDRTWQDNADELAALDQGEGWPYAVLVACSVEKAKPGSKIASIDVIKVSAREFAERAGTSDARIRRYLDTWNKIAAGETDMKASADLTPSDVFTAWHPDVPWKDVYDASGSGGRPRDSKPEDAAKIIERKGPEAVVEVMTPKQRVNFRQALEASKTAEPDCPVPLPRGALWAPSAAG
ncbi:hypothetical protein [Streptomyces prunicolor]|uniref:hypothetical protein n=1 Tax=Streptomyces prunicolor TaxID=67348 RepID=UPI0033ED96C2